MGQLKRRRPAHLLRPDQMLATLSSLRLHALLQHGGIWLAVPPELSELLNQCCTGQLDGGPGTAEEVAAVLAPLVGEPAWPPPGFTLPASAPAAAPAAAAAAAAATGAAAAVAAAAAATGAAAAAAAAVAAAPQAPAEGAGGSGAQAPQAQQASQQQEPEAMEVDAVEAGEAGGQQPAAGAPSTAAAAAAASGAEAADADAGPQGAAVAMDTEEGQGQGQGGAARRSGRIYVRRDRGSNGDGRRGGGEARRSGSRSRSESRGRGSRSGSRGRGSRSGSRGRGSRSGSRSSGSRSGGRSSGSRSGSRSNGSRSRSRSRLSGSGARAAAGAQVRPGARERRRRGGGGAAAPPPPPFSPAANDCRLVAVRLTLEEAFFLHRVLRCLEVYELQPGAPIPATSEHVKLLDEQGLWDACRAIRSNFVTSYAAYHHLKAKGWIPRSGLLYGVDYVIYQLHPVGAHSDFGVLVIPLGPHGEQEGPGAGPHTPPMRWLDLQITNRLINQVVKKLILLYLYEQRPAAAAAGAAEAAAAAEPDHSTPACLQNFLVEERIVRRWVPDATRD